MLLSYDLLVILIELFQIRYTVCSSRYLIFGRIDSVLVYTDLCELFLGVYPEGEQLCSNFYLNCSGAETTSSFSTYK